MFFICKEATYV